MKRIASRLQHYYTTQGLRGVFVFIWTNIIENKPIIMIRKLFTPDDEKIKFDVQSIYHGHHKVSYRGIQAIRCPFDYVIYQMILSELKPDLVIEIGTNKGGGALYIADLMDLIGNGTIHTIDIEKNCEKLVEQHARIKIFCEGFGKYDLKNIEKFSKILVIDDGSHTYEHVKDSLKKFAPVVSKGSYFIVEDGIIDELALDKGKRTYGGGPLKAIREFLPLHPEFEVDKRWRDLFGKNATFNVNGYLKKIA